MSDISVSDRPITYMAATLLLTVGCLMLSYSGVLIQEHGKALAAVRDQGLPLVQETTQLEQREGILQKQVETSRMRASLDGGTEEEQLRLFVLPHGDDVGRAISMLSGAFELWSKEGTAKDVSPIATGDSTTVTVASAPLTKRSLSFSLQLKGEGYKDFFRLLDIAGLLTLDDVLSADDRDILLHASEEGDPEQVGALKEFLSTDLFSYLRQPGTAEEKLRQSFPSDTIVLFLRRFEQSDLVWEGSALARGSVGHYLQDQKMWPLPYLSITSLKQEDGADGWAKLTVTLEAYGRE